MTLEALILLVEGLYRNLLKDGYKLNEIDQMDLFYFLYLVEKEAEEAGKPKLVNIEDVYF